MKKILFACLLVLSVYPYASCNDNSKEADYYDYADDKKTKGDSTKSTGSGVTNTTGSTSNTEGYNTGDTSKKAARNYSSGDQKNKQDSFK